MAQRSANTMVEMLTAMLTDTSIMKTLPDADVAWIIETLETPILVKLREPYEAMKGQMPTGGAPGMGPPPGAPPMAGPGGPPAPGMGGGGPPMPPGPGGPMPPGMPPGAPGAPGAGDELRRMLSMGGGVG